MIQRRRRVISPESPSRLAVAMLIVTIALIIMLVRFPPADLTGWLSVTLHIPLGIPYLVAGALLLGATALLRDENGLWPRVLARTCVAGAVASFVIGVLLINEHI